MLLLQTKAPVPVGRGAAAAATTTEKVPPGVHLLRRNVRGARLVCGGCLAVVVLLAPARWRALRRLIMLRRVDIGALS